MIEKELQNSTVDLWYVWYESSADLFDLFYLVFFPNIVSYFYSEKEKVLVGGGMGNVSVPAGYPFKLSCTVKVMYTYIFIN